MQAPMLLDPGPIHVEENAPVGIILTQLSASDADEKPILRYWIDHAGTAPLLPIHMIPLLFHLYLIYICLFLNAQHYRY